MEAAAKVQLSPEEIALVANPEWILTKNSIMDRAVRLMADLSERMDPELAKLREIVELESAGYVPPPNWDTPKISKGENYLGLPYVILDHPRLFSREHVLAIRTMFWWGHYFSVTLHVKGWMHQMFWMGIYNHAEELAEAGFQIAISGDEWRHEHATDNYRPLEMAEYAEEWGTLPFLKLSVKCTLDKWNKSPEILLDAYRALVRALGA